LQSVPIDHDDQISLMLVVSQWVYLPIFPHTWPWVPNC